MARDLLKDIRTLSEAETIDRLDRLDVNQRNEFAQTALHECATVGYAQLTTGLLGLGVNPDLADLHGKTPLHYACIHGHVDVVRALLDGGASAGISDEHGNQPLWFAVFNARGKYSLVELMVHAGADPDHVNRYDKSPRSFAAQIADRTLIALLARESQG